MATQPKKLQELIEDLSDKQLAAFKSFKTLIESEQLHLKIYREYCDRLILRYLRARKFDVDKSYKMLTEYIKWRHEKQTDSITLEDVKDVLDINFITVIGNDIYSRPCGLVMPGKHKPGSLPYDQLEKLMILFLDVILNELEGELENVMIVIDYEGWGLGNIDQKLDNIFFAIGQNYYPERLYKGLLFKPPTIFSAVWKVVKNFLDERTTAKIHMTSDMDIFNQYFNKDQLAERYGGQLKQLSVRQYLESRLKPKETLGQWLDNLYNRRNPSAEDQAPENLDLD